MRNLTLLLLIISSVACKELPIAAENKEGASDIELPAVANINQAWDAIDQVNSELKRVDLSDMSDVYIEDIRSDIGVSSCTYTGSITMKNLNKGRLNLQFKTGHPIICAQVMPYAEINAFYDESLGHDVLIVTVDGVEVKLK